VLFLDEKLSITLLIGAVVVIFGVFLVVKTESKLTEIVSPIAGEK
jgi:drug/metabolite transporter (DMT)-like permease